MVLGNLTRCVSGQSNSFYLTNWALTLLTILLGLKSKTLSPEVKICWAHFGMKNCPMHAAPDFNN